MTGNLRIISTLLYCLVFAAALSAQVLPSVDIDTAQTQIDQFLQENEILNRRIGLLLATNDELSENLTIWETWLSGIEVVTERLVDRAGELIDILNELASKSLMERAYSVLDRYYRIKATLDEKHRDLTERHEAAAVSIERNTAVVAELKRKIESNLENIELLKAAVERSAGSEETVNTYIENLEAALEDAENALKLP